ncbi:MAG: hypothetical protein EBW53_04125 [Actinobacteria bacterium]|jgi:hypothetical protein|nr:hypothetical protein [Actinomycetota bacterium]NCX18091.1 hypothetical protein [Acidimicrobiia bacterium]NCX60041.1 hypothetical protein [Actinomycetota bacterium]
MTCSVSSAISIVGVDSFTSTAKSPEVTVTLSFLALLATLRGDTVTVSSAPVSVTSSTTEVSFTTNTEAGSGSEISTSSLSADTRYSGFTTTLEQSAARNGRTTTPARGVGSDGE